MVKIIKAKTLVGKGLGGEGNEELLYKRHEVSVIQDE